MDHADTATAEAARRAPATATLVVAALATIVASTRPWTTIKFPRLFLERGEVAAHQTTPGFACLTLSALVLLVVAMEHSGGVPREHRRSLAAVVLGASAAASAVLVYAWLRGASEYRGASMTFTAWFFGALVASLVAAGVAVVRVRAARAVPQSPNIPCS